MIATELDLAAVTSNLGAVEALIVAAAAAAVGDHCLLEEGHPGVGKKLSADRLAGPLPNLDAGHRSWPPHLFLAELVEKGYSCIRRSVEGHSGRAVPHRSR